MKKLLTLFLVMVTCVACCFSLTACGGSGVSKEDIKVGFIFLHDSNSTYDKNFIDAAKDVCAELGLKEDQVIMKTSIAENQACTDAANDLVDKGCNVIFGDSFGHESYLLQVARENPDVQFCHATGTMAHTEGVENFHNAFANIYEGRYLAGVAAGMKIKEMIDTNATVNGVAVTAETAKIGYVGAFTYAEVISGYTSFYLGVKSVVPSVKMDVQFTGSWYDVDGEKTAAETLLNKGAILISQHADSMGCPTACQEKGVPNVFYNGTTDLSTYLISSRINWRPYFKYMIESVINGTKMDSDYVGTIENGAVEIYAPSALAAEGTQAKLDELKAKIQNGTLRVFDVNNFTVGGNKLTTYLADVDTDAKYEKDTEAIKTVDGITFFSESEFRSAPYFDIQIDGINLLNSAF